MKKFCCKTRGLRRGFSLLEVLFTVLILAVLAAVAVPLYSNTKADAETKACKSNIQAIANAESKYKFDTGGYCTTAGTPSATTALQNEGLAVFPLCPTTGGTYTVATLGTGVSIKCSIATHSGNEIDLP